MILFFQSLTPRALALKCNIFDTSNLKKGHLKIRENLSAEEVENFRQEFSQRGYGDGSSKDVLRKLLESGYTLNELGTLLNVSFSMINKAADVNQKIQLSSQRLPRLLEVVEAHDKRDLAKLESLGLRPGKQIFNAGLPSQGHEFFESLAEVQKDIPEIKTLEEFSELFIWPLQKSPYMEVSQAEVIRKLNGDWYTSGERKSEFKESAQKNKGATYLHEAWQKLNPKQKEDLISRYKEKRSWIKNYDSKKSLFQNLLEENKRLDQILLKTFPKVPKESEILKLFFFEAAQKQGMGPTQYGKLIGVEPSRVYGYLNNEVRMPEHEKLRLKRLLFSFAQKDIQRISNLLYVSETEAQNYLNLFTVRTRKAEK